MSDNKHEQWLEDRVSEALALRYEPVGDSGPPGLPDSGASPQEVLDSLITVRRRLDRVEGILTQVITVRGRVRRLAQAAQAEYQEQWDTAVTTDPRLARRDFVAPKERYAHANLAAMAAARTQFQAEQALSVADDAVQVITTAHKGLDSLRYDHVVMLRALTITTSLEA